MFENKDLGNKFNILQLAPANHLIIIYNLEQSNRTFKLTGKNEQEIYYIIFSNFIASILTNIL